MLPTLYHLQRLDSYGVAWCSFTAQYLKSIANQEKICRSERIRAGLAWTKASGTNLGRPSVNDRKASRGVCGVEDGKIRSW